MSTTRNTGSEVTIDSSTFNSVNSTTGGAIVHYNGPLTPVDYAFMAQLALANSYSQTAQASAVPPPANYYTPTPILAHLMPATPGSTLLIRNSTLNGVNNTSGGVIFRFNNPSRATLYTNQSDHEATASDVEVDTDEYPKVDLPQTLKGASHSQLKHSPPTADTPKSQFSSDMRTRRAA
ncbi:hypothetical protein D9619_002575 [Psilocybe cf. subviscida]|uniref:Uncharacterized protein n=1 Tax=Psilocybe cf. subviscida TaxID=2480587 RepID=A0A8H5EUG2_9AGAR|nr:hypothetical protein D9619_002575 [Psilocybe cf. subviscida]